MLLTTFYAGKLHVRFDEGRGSRALTSLSLLLYLFSWGTRRYIAIAFPNRVWVEEF